MPLPVRYADQVPEMTALWSPEGFFQTSICSALLGLWDNEIGAHAAC